MSWHVEHGGSDERGTRFIARTHAESSTSGNMLRQMNSNTNVPKVSYLGTKVVKVRWMSGLLCSHAFLFRPLHLVPLVDHRLAVMRTVRIEAGGHNIDRVM